MKKQALQLQQTPEYWTTKIQLDLLGLIQKYLDENKMKRVAFAKKIGVTKGYITQVMNGDYDHRISKLVELSLAMGYVPQIKFEPFEKAFGENGLYEVANTSSSRNEPTDKDDIKDNFCINFSTTIEGNAFASTNNKNLKQVC